MPSNTGSKQGKPKEKPMDTDVIIIVKGAGKQAEDDHLNIFLRGFWPAVKQVDRNATSTQVTAGFEDYTPSPHNADGKAHKHVVEIRARHSFEETVGNRRVTKNTNRRIWLKEAFWEEEVLPSSALGNLSKEWRMASFIFANMFRNIVFSRNTKKLKEDRLKGFSKFQLWRTPGVRLTDYIGYYVSYFLLFLLVLLPFNKSLPEIAGLSGITLVVVAGLIWAIAPTFEHSAGIYWYLEEDRKGLFKSLPGLPSWVLLALIFLLVSDPLSYVVLITILFGLQVALIMARALLWNQRTYANSDVDIAEYYSYFENGDITKKRFGKVDEWWLTRLPFTPLLYRYLIFLTLPIAFAGTLLASLLKWTRFLGGIGETLDSFLNSLLVGYMDDVVNYAMDPAQANRVRSAVINDIVYFYNKPEVKRIHVVAHSQGTPITYETLFHFLDKKYQDKIITYVTIGSVLSYYHQGRGVLDPVYYERFPVSASAPQNFPESFKWMNFWNFADPITEFYGLDEYSSFEKAPPLDKEFDRTRISPTNIRTRTSIAENHGEYWNNIQKFTLPLAKRVLGELRPPEWKPDIVRSEETADNVQRNWRHYRHHIAVLVVWLAILAGVFFLSRWLDNTTVFDPLVNYVIALTDSALAVYHQLNPPEDTKNPSQLGLLWIQILTGFQYLIGFWMVTDWLGQMRRAVGIAMRK